MMTRKILVIVLLAVVGCNGGSSKHASGPPALTCVQLVTTEDFQKTCGIDFKLESRPLNKVGDEYACKQVGFLSENRRHYIRIMIKEADKIEKSAKTSHVSESAMSGGLLMIEGELRARGVDVSVLESSLDGKSLSCNKTQMKALLKIVQDRIQG